MRRRAVALAFAVALLPLAAPAPAADAPDISPGEWEITIATEMQGLPVAVPTPPMTFTSCVTPEKPVPLQPQQGSQCSVLETKTEGDTVTWRIRCDDGQGGSYDGSGRIVYKSDRVEGEQTMTMTGMGDTPIKMTSKMKGRRLGPCKE